MSERRVLHVDSSVTDVAAVLSIEARRMAPTPRGVSCHIGDSAELNDQGERKAAARAEVLMRICRLGVSDRHQTLAVAGYHPSGRTVEWVQAEKQRLRDLPPELEDG